VLNKISRLEIIKLLPDAEFIELLDEEYQLPTDKEFFKALGFDKSKYGKWNNCNHYTARAKGKLQGRGWPVFDCFIKGTINQKHSVLAYINDQKKFKVVEAQTSMFYADMIQKFHSIKG
jgi:hypothetical protein